MDQLELEWFSVFRTGIFDAYKKDLLANFIFYEKILLMK